MTARDVQIIGWRFEGGVRGPLDSLGIEREGLSTHKVHTDDTPMPVLGLGRGDIRQDRPWVASVA